MIPSPNRLVGHPTLRAIARIAPLLLFLCVGACFGEGRSNQGSGGTPGAPAADPGADPGSAASAIVNLMIGESTSRSLSALEVRFVAFHLADAAEASTPNLLDTPRDVNLMDYLGRAEVLQLADVPPDSYAGARLSIDVSNVLARDAFGSPVPVRVAQPTGSFDFPSTVDLVAGQSSSLPLDIDLDRALADDPLSTTGGLVLRLDGAFTPGPSDPTPIEEFTGRILSSDLGARTLDVDWLDPAGGASLGRFTLHVQDGTMHFDAAGAPLTEAAMFAMAVPGTDVDVLGTLGTDGSITATRIRFRVGNPVTTVRLAGQLTSIDAISERFGLRVTQVLAGSTVADPVLAGLGDPAAALDVAYAASEIVLPVGSAVPTGTPADLLVGLQVRVEFSDFVSPPFPAARIELLQPAGNVEFEGTVVDTSGLPSEFVVTLEPHDPAVVSGAVASSQTSVRVELDGSEPIRVDLPHDPTVSATAIPTGLEIKVRGALLGTPTMPVIFATSVELEPGRLDGVVTAASSGVGTFTVLWDDVNDPFGPPIPNPVACTFAPNALVEDDASSIPSFIALFAGLGAGESLEVRLFGLADPLGGVVAHRLEVDLRGD